MKAMTLTPTWLDTCLTDDSFFSDDMRMHVFQTQQRNIFSARGIPTKRDERWKYTDVRFLNSAHFKKASVDNNDKQFQNIVKAKRLQANDSLLFVFVNGFFSQTLSDLDLLPNDIILCNLRKAIVDHPEKTEQFIYQNFDAKLFPFATLNSALMTDGMFLYFPKNTSIDVPIHFLFLTTEKNSYSCPRNIIYAEEGSRAVILEEHCSINDVEYFTNVVTDIYARDNAQIYYHKIQSEASLATHIAYINVNQARDSIVETFSLALGATLGREDIWVNLKESNSECSINGFYYLATNNQHIDNHAQINHIAPLGRSNMAYKGVLDNKSRAVFNGKIYVYPDAQKTLSRQSNHNLMLSTQAEVDTKPEFEIYADDVKCSHGDTVGQLDQAVLFFLRSRGIEKDLALKMLTRAFAADVLDTIKNTAILDHMNALLIELFTYE